MTKRQRRTRDIVVIICTLIFIFSLNKPVTEYESISYSKFISWLEEGDINEVLYNEESRYALIHQVSEDTRFKVPIISEEQFEKDIFQYSSEIDDFKFGALKEIGQLGWGTKILLAISFNLVLKLTITSAFMSSNLKKKKKGEDVEVEENKNEVIGNGLFKMFESYKPKKADEQEVTFSDVIGLEKQIAEFQDIVRFIKEPGKYQEVGAKLPRGILLHGKAGVGKTLIARAIAGEAKVPFYAISASELQSKFLGESEERIRAVFAEAEANSPAIVFIDEIDSIATQRFSDNSNRYAASIVNQLLSCMDGFSKDSNVIVIAATNHISTLDDALLRSGRFDKKIYIHEPDKEARRKLIEYYSKGKLIDDMLDVDRFVEITAGLTGADIETILNEAAILCVRKGSDFITEEHIMEAFRKVEIGVENSYVIPSREKLERTAVHESGHAVLEHYFGQAVSEISIIARGNTAGYNLAANNEDYNYNQEEIRQRIMCLLGGRAAEEVVYNVVSTGPSDDLKRASTLIKDMFLRFSMRESGDISLVLTEDKSFNEVMMKDSFEGMEQFMRKCYEETMKIIREKRSLLDTLTQELLRRETLTKTEIEDVFRAYDGE